jgi:hypothetical protein
LSNARLWSCALEHHVDRGFRLRDRFGDHHALAGGKPVGLYHDWGAVLAHVNLRRLRRDEAFVGRRWDAVRAAEILGEALRALKPRCPLGRAKRLDAGSFEIVDNAGAERRLRPDCDEADILVLAEGDHRGVVGRIERHAFGLLRNPGIARRAIKAAHQRTRGDLPSQRMFTPAGTEQKNVHSLRKALFRGRLCSMKVRPRKRIA